LTEYSSAEPAAGDAGIHHVLIAFASLLYPLIEQSDGTCNVGPQLARSGEWPTSISSSDMESRRYEWTALTLDEPKSDQAAAQSANAAPSASTTQSASDPSTTQPELIAGSEVAHWSGMPIWGGKEARELGYELPLPLGLAANVFSERANFHVPTVTLGGRGGGLLDIGGLVRVSNVKIEETASTVRADAWVLPFLDVYVVGGYVDGNATVTLRPGLPVLRTRGPKYDLKLKFEGPTVGFGGTLAGGFKPFEDRSTLIFGLTDLNFTRTFLDFDRVVADLDEVDVMVLSTRIGVRERIVEDSPLGEVHASVWGGAMYQNVEEVMPGRLGLLDLNLRANVEAVNPWNTIVGGRLEIGKNVAATIEVGLGDRRSLMLEIAFRF
jgi:hypothetical protein